MGKDFLREFYQSFVENPLGIGFVAKNIEGKITGVVVGPLNPNGYFKRLLKRRWWAFFITSINAVIKRPNCIPRLLRALFYRGEAPRGPERALLSSIAVAPEAQDSGTGKNLVNVWMAEVRKRGKHGCYLTTDKRKNDKVNSFYLQLGWRLEACIVTPEGREMRRYIYDFPK